MDFKLTILCLIGSLYLYNTYTTKWSKTYPKLTYHVIIQPTCHISRKLTKLTIEIYVTQN